MRYENDNDLIRFLRENTSYIVSTFNKSGTRNLRILKHALNDFKKIFEMVNKNYPNTNYRVLQTMLIFTIAVSFEIKAGKITKDKFININDNEEYKAMLVSSRVLMDNRQFYIKEFDNNYYYNFKAEVRFFKFIEMYVRTRIFDMKVFKKDMEAIINTVDKEKLPSYKRLLTEEYWKIPDDQFPIVIKDVIENVKAGKINLIDTVKLFLFFTYFVRKGLIDYDIQTIKTVFFDGMNKASLISDYYENAEAELKELAIGEKSLATEEIMNHFNTINKMLKEKMYSETASEVFKCIPMKMEEFYEKFENQCMNVPIFKYYDPYQFFQRVSCANNEDIVTIKEKMIERAKKYSKETEEEVNNLISLRTIINDYVKGKSINIKITLLTEFAKGLTDIISIYDKKEED